MWCPIAKVVFYILSYFQNLHLLSQLENWQKKSNLTLNAEFQFSFFHNVFLPFYTFQNSLEYCPVLILLPIILFLPGNMPTICIFVKYFNNFNEFKLIISIIACVSKIWYSEISKKKASTYCRKLVIPLLHIDCTCTFSYTELYLPSVCNLTLTLRKKDYIKV